jgi:hypothetical protein
MVVAVLANNFLPAIGVIYLGTIVWKAARGYPFRRWFF